MAFLGKFIIFGILIVFMLAAGSIMFTKIYTSVTDELIDSDKFSRNSEMVMALTQEKAPAFLDYLIIFSFVAFIVMMVIVGLYADFSTPFTIIFIVGLVISVILAGIFSNAYGEIIASDSLSSTAASFKFTDLLMSHLPLWVAVTGFLTLFVAYLKNKNRGFGEI